MPNRESKPLIVHYFLDCPTGSTSGVGQKVLAQVREWKKQGIYPKIFLCCRKSQIIDWQASLNLLCEYEIRSYKNKVTKVLARESLALFEQLQSKRRKNPIYLRLSILTPIQFTFLSMRHYVLEVNSDVLKEYELRFRFVAQLYALMERKILKNAWKTIFVTRELEDLYKRRYGFVDGAYITNGVELAEQQPEYGNFDYDLLLLATEIKTWHGLNVVLDLAILYPNLRFCIVGRMDKPMKDKPLNVTYFSEVDKIQENELLTKSTVGVAQLDLSQLGLKEAAPLKTRTYLSHGLPVLIGYRESIGNNQEDFFLKIEEVLEDESRTVLPEYIAAWSKKRVDAQSLRSMSIEHTERMRVSVFKALSSESEDQNELSEN